MTDICDGIATGHDGMDYSLISRDMIAGMTEIHAKTAGFDGLITSSSCDKAVPGHLMAIARINIPAIHIPGGSMMPGPGFISGDTCYEADVRAAEGAISREEQDYFRRNACPGWGACQYMGTASTMQCMAEALGLALPGSALMPAGSSYLLQTAMAAGEKIAELVAENIRPSDILCRESFMNAIKVHAAIGGSCNATLHLPTIAKEAGICLTLSDFEKYSEGIPLLTSLLTAGKWPTQYFWRAGGIPRIMLELESFLDLDVLTVTGHTIRENLAALKEDGYFRRADEMMADMRMSVRDIIRPVTDPAGPDGGLTILKGNFAGGGAVIKHCAVDPSMYEFTGRARVFEDEESAVSAIYKDIVQPGEVVVIRYVGKKAKGMPEMLKATNAICFKPALRLSTALVTDGRFSGASRGPCVGYLQPEAAEGGEIGLIEDGDLITIDVHQNAINVTGIDGKACSPEEVEKVFAERKAGWKKKEIKHEGVLKFLNEI